MDPLRHVKFYASIKHAGQNYASGLPYTHHLAAVEAVLRRFGPVEVGALRAGQYLSDEEQIVYTAAWLHDAVEDCGVKLKEIREMFGDEVALLVEAVTDEDGPNRRTRKALTYPKIRKAGRVAVRLKLADRIANYEQGGLNEMYKKEHEDFRHALYAAGENEDMWKWLDKLMLVDQ